MKPQVYIETPRLLLRQWRATDYEPFIQMNMDPVVRKYFPGLVTRAESKAHISTIEKNIERQGYGLFAAEWKETGAFIGFIGFSQPGFEAREPLSAAGPDDDHQRLAGIRLFPGNGEVPQMVVPHIEIGWRLSSHYWGRGLATEGAQACLQTGFQRWGIHEIFSFTSVHNLRSEKLMIRIGMTRQGVFAHPSLPAGHWLNEHVLYKATNPPR